MAKKAHCLPFGIPYLPSPSSVAKYDLDRHNYPMTFYYDFNVLFLIFCFFFNIRRFFPNICFLVSMSWLIFLPILKLEI